MIVETFETAKEKTKRLLREALNSPNLDEPGHGFFVLSGEGKSASKHCIVGKVFANLGVDEDRIRHGFELIRSSEEEFGLCPATLQDAMHLYDERKLNLLNELIGVTQ